MNVCFIIEYYYPHIGGFEVLFQNLAEGMVRAGHSCTIVTCRLPGTAKHELVNGVQVHRVSVPSLGDRYWFTLLNASMGWKHARHADIIGTTTYNGALTAWLMAKLLRKPAIMLNLEVVGKNWQRIGLNPLSAFFFRTMENCVLSLPFDAYICISLYTLHSLVDRGKPADKLHLAYPGIDSGLFDPSRPGRSREAVLSRLGIPQNEFVYLYFGRPGFVKGVEHLVRALPLVGKDVPRAKLLMILSRKPTDGYRRIERLVSELGLKKGRDIVIVDPVPREELPDYLKASDCVVVPSLSEGFGFTCVEACAMGKPVVATEVGSIPEVIFGKYVLVKPMDPAALADGMGKIYRNEYSLSDKKEFLWEDMVRKHLAVYEALLAAEQKKRS